MAERHHKFDLKLLTTSRDIGLRKLRSYAASLGGSAQIFQSPDDLRRHLESCGQEPSASVVLHDGSHHLSSRQITDIAPLCRLFLLDPPAGQGNIEVPPAHSPVWQQEAFIRASLPMVLEHPVMRITMSGMCRSGTEFRCENLLRWGYAAETWTPRSGSAGDASLAFIRRLNLTGGSRRLTEMFTHFSEVYLQGLGIPSSSITFGSDGILTIVTARSPGLGEAHVSDVAYQLGMHNFEIALVNRLSHGEFEISALHYDAPGSDPAFQSALLVLNKKDELAVPQLIAVDKAG